VINNNNTAIQNQPRTRYVLLDLIRALAVLGVILWHLSADYGVFMNGYLSIGGIYYISLGSLSVSVFIILSGLVLSLEYRNIEIKFRHFIAKRLLRIYSVYVCIFLFTLVLFLTLDSGYKISFLEFFGTFSGFGAFFGLWRGGNPYYFYHLLNPSWFIGMIISLYLFFPLLRKFIQSYRIGAVISLLIVSIIFRTLLFGNFMAFMTAPEWFPLGRVFEFGLGIYLGLVIKPDIWKILNTGLKKEKALKFLGEISFPLFLVHYPLQWIYLELLLKIGVKPFLAVILYLAASVWLSWFFLYLSKIILAKVKYYSRI